MITLTNPIKIPNSLGGTTFNSYNKMRIVSIAADPVTQAIIAQVQLMVSSDATQSIIAGSLVINTQGSPNATLQIPAIDVFIGIDINSAVATIQGWITSLQNNIEAGLVSTGTVTGTQSTGI